MRFIRHVYCTRVVVPKSEWMMTAEHHVSLIGVPADVVEDVDVHRLSYIVCLRLFTKLLGCFKQARIKKPRQTLYEIVLAY